MRSTGAQRFCMPAMPRLLALALCAGGAAAHSSMTKPLPRGALDRNLSIFKDGAFTQHKVGTHSGCSW